MSWNVLVCPWRPNTTFTMPPSCAELNNCNYDGRILETQNFLLSCFNDGGKLYDSITYSNFTLCFTCTQIDKLYRYFNTVFTHQILNPNTLSELLTATTLSSFKISQSSQYEKEVKMINCKTAAIYSEVGYVLSVFASAALFYMLLK